MVSNGKYFFMYLLATGISSLEMSIRSFAYFLIGLFFPLSCRCSKHILDINFLSNIYFTNIFFYLVGCLFILLMISFAVQKLLSLM